MIIDKETLAWIMSRVNEEFMDTYNHRDDDPNEDDIAHLSNTFDTIVDEVRDKDLEERKSGEQMSFKGVIHAFEESNQTTKELLTILRENISDACVHRQEMNDDETHMFLYAIFDEFNHDPKVKA